MKINYTNDTPNNATYLLGVTPEFKSVLVKSSVISELTRTREEVLRYLEKKGPQGEKGNVGETIQLTTDIVFPTSNPNYRTDLVNRLFNIIFDNKISFNNDTQTITLNTSFSTNLLKAKSFKSQ